MVTPREDSHLPGAFGYPLCMKRLIASAAAAVARHDLLTPDSPVLVMLSGGGDSVALLTVLASGALGERPIRALHVNHLLRREESEADEEFCVELCEELGIGCRVVRYDVAAYAESERLNLEDAGRIIRYRFADEELDAWCLELGVPSSRGRIATAHTLDDRVETFFMRVISGAGPGALSSIAARRGRVIRPLIECGRDELRAALAAADRRWREDASNSDTTRSRALVRAELLPVAQRLNPNYRAAVARTMDLLGDDDALLTRMADGFARDFAYPASGEVRFDRRWMLTLDRAMARRTVRAAVLDAFPEASRLEAAHVEAIVDGLAEDGFRRDLPGGLSAFTEYATLVVSRTDMDTPRVAPCLLPLPGHAHLGAAGAISASLAPVGDVDGGRDSVVIDAGRVAGELTVDSVREGDRMRPLGMDGSKKLSDLLVDAKVPQRQRRSVPVVRDGERIVWLAGVRMSDEYRVTPATDRAVRLTWRRADDISEANEGRE